MTPSLGFIGKHGIEYYRFSFSKDERKEIKNAIDQYWETQDYEFRGRADFDSVFSMDRNYGLGVDFIEGSIYHVARDIESIDVEPSTDWPKRALYPEFSGLGFFKPLNEDSIYNAKLVHEDEDFMLSIPKDGDRPFYNFEFEDFEELLMYQITLKRNFDNLSERGIPTPDSDVVVSSYAGEPYALLLTKYRNDLTSCEELFGDGESLDNIPVDYREQKIDETIISMLEEAKLASINPFDHKEPKNIGFNPVTDDYLFWDPGELSRVMERVTEFPYDRIKDFWEEEGIKDQAESFMRKTGLSNYQY